MEEEQHHYQNEQGLLVFTEAYHRKRGFCCGCGCRHCPYDFEAVNEPRRSELQAKKKMKKNPQFEACLQRNQPKRSVE